MTKTDILLEPNTLWKQVQNITQNALACGALKPIPTSYEIIESAGIPFMVRILTNLIRKEKAQQKREQKSQEIGQEINPFLPYEQDLFVSDISNSHLCILNKYNVVEHHLLIITRQFEEQDVLLNIRDFTALAACLAQIDGLGFYNGGKIAGASVRHKHLQIVPLPLTSSEVAIPIQSAIALVQFKEQLGRMEQLPFNHAIAQLDLNWTSSPFTLGNLLLEQYYRLLDTVGLADYKYTNPLQPAPYNLLVTRQWMFLIPRVAEQYQGIGVNSLGFAGGLLVRNPQELEFIKDLQPINLLAKVAQPILPH